MNQLILTDSTDPWRNLALEETLFDFHREGCCLYLWQNQNTVVIGRNQNAWKECRTAQLEADGGKLARRTTGGGAVFHDLGNLNFTFVATKQGYDQTRQTRVILEAVRALGIQADFTGRNDLVTKNGEKFSGNAYRHSSKASMQHGTLLVDVNMEKLGAYLAPSKEKLAAKGVQSVRARVCNLKEYAPGLTIGVLKEALTEAFKKEYGEYRPLLEGELDQAALAAAAARHASWEWRMGGSPSFDMRLETRFSWGGVELLLSFSHGFIQGAEAYSDAMDEAFIRRVAPALTGVRFTSADMAAALSALGGTEARDLAGWLAEKEL